MTTSSPAGKSTGRHAADPEPSPSASLPEPVSDDRAPQAVLPAGAETRPPDDLEQLQQEIEQTREQLGDTVQQLVAQADIKARAQAKVSELAGRAKGKASQARAQAADGAGGLRDQVASKTADVSQKATSAGTAVTEQLPGRVAAAAAQVWKATPEPARQAVAKAAGNARQRPVPLAVAAVVLIVGYLVVGRWRKR
jgi:flagellar biosynthesis/type III secretory pathway protein FliH